MASLPGASLACPPAFRIFNTFFFDQINARIMKELVTVHWQESSVWAHPRRPANLSDSECSAIPVACKFRHFWVPDETSCIYS